jgi:3,4-dihydroxy 2-butanone 4-phosphate synthase/GTP cyclohydrolase II
MTGDVFHSLRCDCGEQRDTALERIAAADSGVMLYMRQEGHGIGLAGKLAAYRLQDEGLDTVEAIHQLGFPADGRDYTISAQILKFLGLQRIRVLTNNPRKVHVLKADGLQIVERVPLHVEPNTANRRYLETKRDKLGHQLPNLSATDPALSGSQD